MSLSLADGMTFVNGADLVSRRHAVSDERNLDAGIAKGRRERVVGATERRICVFLFVISDRLSRHAIQLNN
ncbi:hypothetical protein [Roseovarius sp. A46]|uniref:hypothetical protein n=1 Tax=Roseovarius sp. A46 TaxID=2109331 RepID=UPI001011DAB3|nr:hypothetical protein [Roseovarius sp. A46]